MAFAPTIARLYVQKDFAALQEKATRAAQAILLMALPISLILTVFGRPILSLSGVEFVVGYPAMAILNLGYILNAAMGTSGYLLIMTKHERAAAVTFASSAAINVAANLIFIPLWGVNGAAIATALSISVVSVVFAILAYRKLAIQPTAFFVRWQTSPILSAHSPVVEGAHDKY
jgi:O-antigen/teichoic acid export membrane protein